MRSKNCKEPKVPRHPLQPQNTRLPHSSTPPIERGPKDHSEIRGSRRTKDEVRGRRWGLAAPNNTRSKNPQSLRSKNCKEPERFHVTRSNRRTRDCHTAPLPQSSVGRRTTARSGGVDERRTKSEGVGGGSPLPTTPGPRTRSLCAAKTARNLKGSTSPAPTAEHETATQLHSPNRAWAEGPQRDPGESTNEGRSPRASVGARRSQQHPVQEPAVFAQQKLQGT